MDESRSSVVVPLLDVPVEEIEQEVIEQCAHCACPNENLEGAENTNGNWVKVCENCYWICNDCDGHYTITVQDCPACQEDDDDEDDDSASHGFPIEYDGPWIEDLFPFDETICTCSWCRQRDAYDIRPAGEFSEAYAPVEFGKLGYLFAWPHRFGASENVTCRLWGFDSSTFNPVQAMADFYLLEGIASGVANRSHSTLASPEMQSLRREAKMRLDALTKHTAFVFSRYVDLVVGGELRHMADFKQTGFLPQERTATWLAWRHIRCSLGSRALEAAATVFGKYGFGGYGGNAWAQAARLLLAYETGKIPANLFIDRVFSMQHNTGSLLNKFSWRADTHLSRIVSEIGPAHAARNTHWQILMKRASDENTRLFRQWWLAANKMQRRPHGDGPRPVPDSIKHNGPFEDRPWLSHQMRTWMELEYATFFSSPRWLYDDQAKKICGLNYGDWGMQLIVIDSASERPDETLLYLPDNGAQEAIVAFFREATSCDAFLAEVNAFRPEPDPPAPEPASVLCSCSICVAHGGAT